MELFLDSVSTARTYTPFQTSYSFSAGPHAPRSESRPRMSDGKVGLATSIGNANGTQNGSSRRRKTFDRERFKTFHAELGNPDYLPDFNASVDAVIGDKRIGSLALRCLEVWKQQAWANQSKLAVHDGTHTPFNGSDCARRLGVAPQRVADCDQYLIDNFLLRVEGSRHYPVVDPAVERAKFPGPHVSSSPNLRQFTEGWFDAHPEESKQYKEAVRTLSQIKNQIRSEFRAASRASGGDRKAADTPGDSPSGEFNTEGPEKVTQRVRKNDHPTFNSLKQSIKGMHAGQVHRLNALREFFDETITDQSLDRLDEHLKDQLGQDYEVAHLVHLVAQRRRKGRIGAGLLLNLEKGIPHDFCELSRRRSPSPELQDLPQEVEKLSPAQEIERLTELIEHFPDHANVSTWREEITELQSRQAATGGSS